MSESERPRLSAKKSTGVKVEVFDEEFELKPITRQRPKGPVRHRGPLPGP
jgi:hypothetical protein